MVMDMGKYYVVMKWVKGVEDKYLDYELRYGRLLLKNNDEVCFTYLNKEKENIEKIINSLPVNGKSDTTDRKKELILKLGLVHKALSFYDN
jgi:tRNA A22 N-methylase